MDATGVPFFYQIVKKWNLKWLAIEKILRLLTLDARAPPRSPVGLSLTAPTNPSVTVLHGRSKESPYARRKSHRERAPESDAYRSGGDRTATDTRRYTTQEGQENQ
jgi:hypothetical protein